MVLILGILATFAMPMFEDARNRSKVAELYATVSAIEKGERLYYLEHNKYVNINKDAFNDYRDKLGVDIPGADSVFIYRAYRPWGFSDRVLITVYLREDGDPLCYKYIGGTDDGKWFIYDHPWAKYLSIPEDLQLHF